MRISDWSSDVCSSDLHPFAEIAEVGRREQLVHRQPGLHIFLRLMLEDVLAAVRAEVELLTLVNGLPIAMPRGIARLGEHGRSDEHTSELQSLMRISYAVFCLTTQKHKTTPQLN